MAYSVVSLSDLESLQSLILVSIRNECLDRRSKGLGSLNVETISFDYYGMKFSRKRVDLLILLTICTFTPELLGSFATYTIVEVQDYLEKNCLFPELAALSHLTKEKYVFLYCLLTYCDYTPQKLLSTLRDGTTLKRVLKSVRLLKVFYRKPKRLVRHKGYRDHGTLRPPTRWVETEDATFEEFQRQKEKKQEEFQEQTNQYIRECWFWYLESLNFERR